MSWNLEVRVEGNPSIVVRFVTDTLGFYEEYICKYTTSNVHVETLMAVYNQEIF